MPNELPVESAAASGGVPLPTVDSPQQESSGDADASRNGLSEQEAVSRSEFSKVVAQRQASKEKARQLTAEVEQLLARLRQVPSDEELRAFQEWKRRQQEAGIPPEQGPRDLQAIEQRLREPLRTRIEDLCGRKDVLEQRLADLVRDQELRIAAARANAINPEQVVTLLRQRVRVTETADGRFAPEFLDADGQPLFNGPDRVTDSQRFVDLFLSASENANLVRPTVKPGSGARQAGGLATHVDSLPRSKGEFLSLPPDERLAAANRMTRQQRDAILGRGSADDGAYL